MSAGDRIDQLPAMAPGECGIVLMLYFAAAVVLLANLDDQAGALLLTPAGLQCDASRTRSAGSSDSLDGISTRLDLANGAFQTDVTGRQTVGKRHQDSDTELAGCLIIRE